MNRTYRILISALAAGGAFFGYWHLALAPKRAEVASLQTQVATAQSTLAQAQSTVAQYKGAERAYRANYAKVVRLGKAVPADDDVRSMLVQLDAAAGDSKVSFSDIEVGGSSSGATSTGSTGSTGSTTAAPATPLPPGAIAVGGAGFSELPLKFTFDGSYSDLTRFLARVDRFVRVKNQQVAISGRLLRVESLELTPAGTGWPALQAQITASSYLVPATQGLTAGASATAPATSTAAPTATATATPSTATATTATTGVLR